MIRITAGRLKGRAVRTPPGDRTRPTQAKLRQALFNSIQFELEGAHVLDLFAGSGALGFEALSRGAEHVVFVERVPSVAKLIEKSALELGVRDRIEIVSRSLDEAIRDSQLVRYFPFDLVFADPPYEQGFERMLLSRFPWRAGLKASGKLCLESSSGDAPLPEVNDGLIKVREKKYGDTLLTTYQRVDETQGR